MVLILPPTVISRSSSNTSTDLTVMNTLTVVIVMIRIVKGSTIFG